MDSTRRHYLQYAGGAALPAALAGCIGTVPDDDTDNKTEPGINNTDNATDGGTETRPEGTGGPGVTIATTDDDPDIPIQPAVEVDQEAATTEHPPRLRTILTNTSDEAVSVGEGRAVHFEYVTADDGLLTLLPPAGDDNYPAEAGCWRLSDRIVTTAEYRTVEIAAGESSSRPVDLYATTEADGCLPVGEYRFETTISVPSDDNESSALWGFSVVLE